MSSSFVVEPQDSGCKKDDTLIIVVNDDGTISVDQETLQNLIMNQTESNVSVVRVGQSDGDAENGDLTLTVDPPPFATPETAITATSVTDNAGLVDPFMEMDPEQLEKLETALQSEQAKQILGENVTAMLDMLTVEEEQKSIKYCIELDHCYTSRTSPTDPEPSDPLPIAHSPDIDDFEYKHSNLAHQTPSLVLPASTTVVDNATPISRTKLSSRPPMRTLISRGRKIVTPSVQQSPTAAKTVNASAPIPRNSNAVQQQANKGVPSGRLAEQPENAEATSSSESSESEAPSDDDSDFGPRGPRRGGGVRARGGRKGLTTRGGSMTATRRRGANKQMDMDQVRRLNIEMAAAVDAMKSPEKSDRADRFTPIKAKKQLKTLGGRKKEEPSPGRGIPPVNESPPVILEKPLQTTNQVKANLINANMIKGDMILTKPGQARNNQKVMFIQKNVMVKANEMRNLGVKKPSIILTKGGKTMPLQIQTKLGTSETGKLVSVGGRVIAQTVQTPQISQPSIPTTPNPSVCSPAIAFPTLQQESLEFERLQRQEQQQQQKEQEELQQQQRELQQQQQQRELQQQQQRELQQQERELQHQQQLREQQQQQQREMEQQELQRQKQQQQQQQTQQSVKPLVVEGLPIKTKTSEVKKEKKKSESELLPKTEEPAKPLEMKTPDTSKKHLKKDQRKSPAVSVDALGPALFSTPDIIRRVGSGAEAKGPDVPGTPTTPTPSTDSDSAGHATTASTGQESSDLSSPVVPAKSQEENWNIAAHSLPEEQLSSDMETQMKAPIDTGDCLPQVNCDELKADTKVPTADELQPSLDPATDTALATGIPELRKSTDEPVVPNQIISEQSGIEGEEHLLATLEMEASKPEDELLAEALLLQEQLGVDLADHASLVEPTASIPEPLLSTSAFERPIEGADETQEIVENPEAMKIPETAQSLDVTKVSESVPLESSPASSVSTVVTVSAPLASPVATVPAESTKKRDEKEPIQIVRGGRVITLPPIEAPATRSKRLQAKPEVQHIVSEVPKKEEKLIKHVLQQQQQHQQQQQDHQMSHQQFKEIEEMESEIEEEEDVDDDEDDEDDEGDNSDSEDDPDRLWCICKRPHNNRFMICCDVCEDWFHGKCVHVSKAMGQQMEEKGIEWVCPNCTKKKEQEAAAKQTKIHAVPGKPLKLEIATRVSVEQPSQVSTPRPSISPIEKIVKLPGTPTQLGMPPVSGVTQCVVCKKEARNSSIYCSDACILMHAQETQTKESKPATVTQPKTVQVSSDAPAKPVTEPRVIVFERRTGKVLTGSDAPTRSTFRAWLKENPTYEVVHPNNLNTLQIGGKTVTAIQTQGIGKLVKTVQGTQQGLQSKMVYTKVLGSKQTVLAPSNKKLVVVSSGGQQQRATIEPKTLQLKPQQVPGAAKSPLMRQTTIKIVSQQVKSPATPKQTVAKKPEVKTPQQQKIVQKTPPTKKSEPEPIRVNVRKTLAESLTTRITSSPDLKLTEDEITELGLNIELELYKYFRDTGAKYKAKYRSLVFNIKDTKNLTLFRKIADRSLTPDAVVRLSPDEMASQELAEWREKETKHQLEMIKKNELDLMAQAKSIVVKTHKGEQIIENEGLMDHVDPKTPVQDIVTALNSHELSQEKDESHEKVPIFPIIEDLKKLKGSEETKKKKEKEKDKERNKGTLRSKDKDRVKEKREERSHSRGTSHRSRERSRDRRSTRSKDSKRDRERDRDKDRDREKGKDKIKDKDRQKKSRSSRASHRDYKDKEKKDEERKKDSDKKSDGSQTEVEKPIEDRLWRHVEEETTSNTLDGNDSDVSDREPSSTVNIKTPDINEEPEREKESEPQPVIKHANKGPSQTVWRGFVNMVDVAKFFITAQEVSGHARDLMEDLPDTVDVVGRISHETVWDYISKMKKTGSKEILVIRLTAANDEEKIPYITLYSYLNSRSRLGVVGNVSKNIKDFYIMPFSRQSKIPPVLLPLVGPGFEDQRPHLLLGIIVRNKRKRVSTTPSGPIPAKIVKKDADPSGQTPAIASASKDKAKPLIGSHSPSSPPSSPRPHHKSLLLDAIKEKQSVTQITLENLNKAHVGMSRGILDNSLISKIVPELSSKIEITDSPKVPTAVEDADDDGDEPYSPGGIDNEPDDTNLVANNAIDELSANILSPTKNSTELQRKMDELNRQIEEQKQQIQSISSSFLGDATTTTLPGLGLDPPHVADMDEAYSPTDARSFTPPPPGIAKFAQPILDKVSDITIPPNLQEILANVKRQEISKVDPYLPSKPGATFLTSVNSSVYQKPDKYTPTFIKNCPTDRTAPTDKPLFSESSPPPARETKSTLSTLSDLDLIKKAAEELAAVEYTATAASLPTIVQNSPINVPPPFSSPPAASLTPIANTVFPGLQEATSDTPVPYASPNLIDSGVKKTSCNFASNQPKPPGLEDEELPIFPSTPPTTSPQKFVPKSGIVLSVKRKVCEDGTPVSPVTPVKTPRTKSRWGQGPSE